MMRERTRLEESIGRYRKLEAALNDNLELIEMGEAEGDEAIVAEAEAALRAARDEAGEAEVAQLPPCEADANDTYVELAALAVTPI